MVAILVLATVVLFGSTRKEKIDFIPIEGEDVDYSSQVNLVADENLVSALGGVAEQDRLSSDLYVFAKTAYSKYSDFGQNVIGFKTSKIVSEDGEVMIEGRFGATKNKILVVVKPLNHSMINSSITDSETELNIDSMLPSNTKRNQFIGTLPIEKPNYVIEYVEETDDFTVNIFNGAQSSEEVNLVLKEGLGTDNLESEDITTYGVGFSGYNNDY